MSLVWSAHKVIHPPVAVLCLDELAVSGALDRRVGIKLAHQRIVGRWLIRSKQIFRASYIDAVPISGAALRQYRVIVLPTLQQMRSLGAPLAGSLPHRDRIAGHFRAVIAQWHEIDARADDHVMPAVIVHKVRRVDAVHLKPARFAVRSLRLIGGDDELSSHDIAAALSVGVETERRHDDESAVVVRDIRRPDAVRVPDILQIQFIGIGDGVSDHLPVHHVL